MITTRKAFDLSVLACGAITIAAMLPIIGGIVTAGVDILHVPSWVFGAGGSFLVATAICYPFCSEEGKRQLDHEAPPLLAVALLVSPVYLLAGLGSPVYQSGQLNIIPIGQITAGFSVFAVPAFVWIRSLGALGNTLESKAGDSRS